MKPSLLFSTVALLVPSLAAEIGNPQSQARPTVDSAQGWFGSVQAAIFDRLAAVSNELTAPLLGSAGPKKGPGGFQPVEVRNLTLDNWKTTVLAPAVARPGWTAEWMVLMTGGKTSCGKGCTNITAAWKESIPLFEALPIRPHLGRIDCDADADLCNSWAAKPPAIWHLLITVDPAEVATAAGAGSVSEDGEDSRRTADGAAAASAKGKFPPFHSTVRVLPALAAAASKTDILHLYIEETWKQTDPLPPSSVFHPFDGLVARHGLERTAATVVGGMNGTTLALVLFMACRLALAKYNRDNRPEPARLLRERLSQEQQGLNSRKGKRASKQTKAAQ